MNRRTVIVITATTVTLGLASCCIFGNRVPARPGQPSLRELPPFVEQAALQPLEREVDGGNTALEVQFDREDGRIGKTVEIMVEDEPVLLRDDGRGADREAGDRVFTAALRIDWQDLARDQAVALSRWEKEPARSVFVGRSLVGTEDREALLKRFRASPLLNAEALRVRKPRLDLFDLLPSVVPSDIKPAHSLMITDPAVVADPARTVNPCAAPGTPAAGNPNGVWTFNHLITAIANQAATGIDPADLTENWLRQWLVPQTVSSGFAAAPRSRMSEVLDNWPRRPDGKLDLDRSPFRLAAIVNRIDLTENLVYGAGSAGEGRFVFGVMDRRPNAPACHFLPFSVIFEYGITKRGCAGLRGWANQWIALGNHPLGSPAYNQALEDITEQFAKANAAPNKPNGNALNQLRTNENALNVVWELREFRINAGTHLLFTDTTKQTPDETLNRTAVINDYIDANEAAILAGTHIVPDHFPPGVPFLAATSRATSPAQLSTHFQGAPPRTDLARHKFSLATCSACHMRETNTTFLHVDPRTIPAPLSGFLTGSTPNIDDSPDPFQVPDPADAAQIHEFNDLRDRRQKLAEFASANCIRRLLVPRLPREFPRGRPIDPRLNPIGDPRRMTH